MKFYFFTELTYIFQNRQNSIIQFCQLLEIITNYHLTYHWGGKRQRRTLTKKKKNKNTVFSFIGNYNKLSFNVSLCQAFLWFSLSFIKFGPRLWSGNSRTNYTETHNYRMLFFCIILYLIFFQKRKKNGLQKDNMSFYFRTKIVSMHTIPMHYLFH